MEFIFFMAKVATSKESALGLTADSMLYTLQDKQDTKGRRLLNFKIPASQKSLLHILGLQAKDEWPNISEEP
ncbi:hypothetical protein ACQP3D_24920 [Escherichia coli]